MEKIVDVSFNKFRNGEHFQFMTDVKDLVLAATLEKTMPETTQQRSRLTTCNDFK